MFASEMFLLHYNSSELTIFLPDYNLLTSILKSYSTLELER